MICVTCDRGLWVCIGEGSEGEGSGGKGSVVGRVVCRGG